jgi:hypothetical protein
VKRALLAAACLLACSIPPPDPHLGRLDCTGEAPVSVRPGEEWTCRDDGWFHCPVGRHCTVTYWWPAKNRVGVAPVAVTSAHPEIVWRGYHYRYAMEGP